MARQAKLRKKTVGKSTYWYTKAGGDTYFGNVLEVTYKDAKKMFADHLRTVQDDAGGGKKGAMTAGELMDLFLDWVQKWRDEQNYTTRKTYCSRFGAFKPEGGTARVRELPADKVRGKDLEDWRDKLAEDGLGPQTRLHAETSIRACWNWATKHPSPGPYLSPTFRPFSAVERTHVPLRPLNEADLMTDAEAQALFSAAGVEGDQFRRHGVAKTVKRKGLEGLRRTEGQVGCFAALLRCYHATGARTDELAGCLVGDVQFQTKQLVLGNHKTLRTEKRRAPRQVALNDEAQAIFARHCHGRAADDHVFFNSDGRPWTVGNLAKRFRRAKQVAAVLKLGTVRKCITIYDFRDLWISESLMAGNDVALVARMSGTSIKMIEEVYGHFRAEHLQNAQAKVDDYRRGRKGG